jgi:hypothetical protein
MKISVHVKITQMAYNVAYKNSSRLRGTHLSSYTKVGAG